MAIAVRGFLRFWVAAKRTQTGLFDPGIGSGRLRRLARHRRASGVIFASRQPADFRHVCGSESHTTHQDRLRRVPPPENDHA
jgi:hypothetical protein